jgi:antiviral helicase SKI2
MRLRFTSEPELQPFEQITNLTDVAEGTIVRIITRLDETCREVRDAARVIGDAELFKKMEESQIKIKRDSTLFSPYIRV